MKKFLSLVLALVMTMSLVTISAGAKDFTDDETITYDEAVAVISEVKVVDGYTDDSFKPTATLTRGAAAKIICNLILGPTTAAELPASVAPFKDVPANSTFAGYIAYCAKEGIVGGYADGTFKPGASLTGYAFMKMLLGALGYDAEIEGYNTPGTWSISVAKQALGIGLNAGLREDFNGVKPVTREEACLYAFNTLKATMVDYDTKTSVNVGDATVTIAGSTAKPVAWNNMNIQTGINFDGNIDADGFVQFAEQYFTKLEVENSLDAFGRPARTWDYKGDEIDTYVAWDLMVKDFTGKVTGKDLYDLLGKGTIEDKDYDIYVFVDGESSSTVLGDAYFNRTAMNKNNKDKVGETGDGVVTEVYVNSDTKEVFVCVINTYMAKARADYSEKKEEASFDVYALDNKGTTANPIYVKTKTDNVKDVEILDVSNDDFDVADVLKDEAYLVTVAEGEIQSIEKAEVLSDVTLSSFSKGSYVVSDGEKYSYADTVEYDPEVLDQYTSINSTINLKELSYNIYLDQNGLLIGIDLVETPKNYVFITGIDTNGSNLANVNADANAIFIDGTVEAIKVNLTKGNPPTTAGTVADTIINKWCTYTVDKNGVYTLNVVGNAAQLTAKNKVAQYNAAADVDTASDGLSYQINKKHVALPGAANGTYSNVYGNDATVYLTAELSKLNGDYIAITGVESVTTGVKNANITAYTKDGVQNLKTAFNGVANVSCGVYTLYKDNGYIIATVVVGKDDAASKNLVYVNSSDVELESYDASADEWTWTREVIADGVKTEIKEKGDTLTHIGAAMTKGNWYQVKYNADGFVIGIVGGAALGNADSLAAGYVDGTTAGSQAALIPAAVVAKDTVLYSNDRFQNVAKAPYLIGSTLYVDTLNNTGFFVDENVKSVLIQKNDNKTTTSYEEGVENLERMLKDLNKDADGYDYIVSAILESGAAKVVVIEDKNATGNAGSTPEEETPSIKGVTVDATNGVIYVKYYGATMNLDQALAAINKELVKNYTINSKTFEGGWYTYNVTSKATGFTTTLKFAPTVTGIRVYKVTLEIDDALKTVAPNLTASADVDYVAAGGQVTVTIKNPTAISSAKNVSAKDADGNAIGNNVSSDTGDTTVTATWTMPGGSGAKDVILTVGM